MKVLFCLYRDSEESGGSFRVAEVAIKSLMEIGVEVHVAVAYGGGGRLKISLEERCHLVGAENRRDLRGWKRYRSLLSKVSPDVVHYIDPVGWMVIAGAGLSIKRVMHQHFRPDVGTRIKRRAMLIRILFGAADKVVSISHGAARVLQAQCKVTPDRICVIHNAVDLDRFSPSNKEPGAAKKLGMAIRVVEDKGIADAIALLRVLPETFTLAVAGQGPAMNEMKELARIRGVDHRIEWRGAVHDVASFFSGIDYYLFMSWYEGFGLSVAEAMASGTPVVGLLGDGEISEPEYPLVTPLNSLLVNRSTKTFSSEPDPRVISDLAEALLMLESDPDRRVRMTEAAHRWIENRFSHKIYAEKLHKLYSGMIAPSLPADFTS